MRSDTHADDARSKFCDADFRDSSGEFDAVRQLFDRLHGADVLPAIGPGWHAEIHDEEKRKSETTEMRREGAFRQNG